MSLPMKEYVVGGEVYEIVDQAARNNIDLLQADMDEAKEDVSELIRITDGYSDDIERLKLASITPDKSLSIDGAAADSKVVGDKISQLYDTMQSDHNHIFDTMNNVVSKMVDKNQIVNNVNTVEEGYVLDARQAYELYMLVQKRATTFMCTATFPRTGWIKLSEKLYMQTVYINDILESDNPIVDIDISQAKTDELGISMIEEWNLIKRAVTNNGSITLYSYEEIPSVDLKIIMKVVR